MPIANELDQGGKVGVERFEESEPILAVVNFKSLEGREFRIRGDDTVDLGQRAAVFARNAHVIVRRKWTHHQAREPALRVGKFGFMAHADTSTVFAFNARMYFSAFFASAWTSSKLGILSSHSSRVG